MYSDYQKQVIHEVAQRIKKQGFRVFIAENGNYGFFTNEDGTRLVGFHNDLGGLQFTGHYKTDTPKQTGTGWRIIKDSDGNINFKTIFEAGPPEWATQGSKWKFTTLDQYLTTYQKSSRFREV